MPPPRWDDPAADRIQKKIPARRASKEALKRETFAEKDDFHGPGVTPIDSSLFHVVKTVNYVS